MKSGALIRAVLLSAAVSGLATGCSSVGYYAQSIGGHLNLLAAARPVPEWLADPATPDKLKARLELTRQIRALSISSFLEICVKGFAVRAMSTSIRTGCWATEFAWSAPGALKKERK